MDRPFLDFYSDNSIIPTLEDTGPDGFADGRWAQQREFLLWTMGIAPGLLRGSSILEIGPGTSQKAQHLLTFRPRSYTAVDGNPSSLQATRRALAQFVDSVDISIVTADFLDLDNLGPFDFAIAEGVIPLQKDPAAFLRKLITMIAPSGLAIITCADPMSTLPEILRRAISVRIGLLTEDLHESAESVASFFASDLSALPGMTRVHRDWAMDQVVHPWTGRLLSIGDAITAVRDSAQFLGSSPAFVTDFRWYKDAGNSMTTRNDVALRAYWTHAMSLMDCRVEEIACEPMRAHEAFQLCDRLFNLAGMYVPNLDTDSQIETLCTQLVDLLPRHMTDTRNSLQSFLTFWNSSDLRDLERFRPWWGRGSQYVSFVRT